MRHLLRYGIAIKYLDYPPNLFISSDILEYILQCAVDYSDNNELVIKVLDLLKVLMPYVRKVTFSFRCV